LFSLLVLILFSTSFFIEIELKNPTFLSDDYKLGATPDKDAPITIVRLIVAGKPLTEKEIGFVIFRLAIFSGILAVITAFLMSVRI